MPGQPVGDELTQLISFLTVMLLKWPGTNEWTPPQSHWKRESLQLVCRKCRQWCSVLSWMITHVLEEPAASIFRIEISWEITLVMLYQEWVRTSALKRAAF